MCEIYWDPDKVNNRIALYQYGFPGSIGTNLLIDYLVELGFYVILPHFPGTFDSAGEFTPINTYNFYKKINDSVVNGATISLKNNKLLNIPLKIEYAFGHSYGCWTVLRGARYLKELKTIFLFGPAITYSEYNFKSNCGLIENGLEHINMVIKSRPYTFRLNDVNSFLKLYKGDYDDFNIPLTLINNVIGVVGLNDPYFDLKRLRNRFNEIITSFFNDEIECRLIEVEGGNHSLESLLNGQIKFQIESCL